MPTIILNIGAGNYRATPSSEEPLGVLAVVVLGLAGTSFLLFCVSSQWVSQRVLSIQHPSTALASSNIFSPVHLAIPVLLILLRVAYSQARRFLGYPITQDRSMTYLVKWGRERLHFPLPSQDTKLAVIRNQLAEYTQLPEHSFKLVHAGAVMKDDNAPISAYGIKENSTIAIIGGGDNHVPGPTKSKLSTPSTPPQRPTEENTITQIRSELDKVRQSLQPDVDTFLSHISPPSSSSTPNPISSPSTDTTESLTAPPPEPAGKPKSKPSASKGKSKTPSSSVVPPAVAPTATAASPSQTELAQEHIRLGELLLQSLLRLDAINAEGEWDQARKERKGAVREVQALLDRLDGGWRSRPRS